MERVVDIETEELFLAVHRGFLTVSSAGEEKGRIPLDDIGALIVHAHGTSWSNSVMVRLSERAVPVVICRSNHAPVGNMKTSCDSPTSVVDGARKIPIKWRFSDRKHDFQSIDAPDFLLFFRKIGGHLA